jgi:hypothetical protein
VNDDGRAPGKETPVLCGAGDSPRLARRNLTDVHLRVVFTGSDMHAVSFFISHLIVVTIYMAIICNKMQGAFYAWRCMSSGGTNFLRIAAKPQLGIWTDRFYTIV